MQANTKTFLDVGANIGYFTLWAAALGHKVIAVEPMKKNIALLRASVCLNGPAFASNIQLYHTAVSAKPRDEGGCVVMTELKGDRKLGGDGGFECNPEVVKLHPEHVVNVSRLDDLLMMCGGKVTDARGAMKANSSSSTPYEPSSHPRYPILDLMKIDIEGYEQGAIESGMRAWRREGPNGGKVEGGGPPAMILFECSQKQAVERGFSTQFWRRFASEFGCTLDHSLEMMGEDGSLGGEGPESIRGPFPVWVTDVVPLLSTILLQVCGGTNFAITCDSLQASDAPLKSSMWIAVTSKYAVCIVLIAFVRFILVREGMFKNRGYGKVSGVDRGLHAKLLSQTHEQAHANARGKCDV